MWYYKKCPHCRSTVEGGHGIPMQHLGDPIIKCHICRKEYVDKDIIEWDIVPVYKKIGYCFANNRFWICFLPWFFASMWFSNLRLFPSGTPMVYEWLICSPIFILMFGLCYAYVRHQLHQEKEDINDQAEEDIDYIRTLIRLGYPVKRKYVLAFSKPTAVEIDAVVDHCHIYARVLERNKEIKLVVDINKYPDQRIILYKRVGDSFEFPGIPLTYRIEKIVMPVKQK